MEKNKDEKVSKKLFVRTPKRKIDNIADSVKLSSKKKRKTKNKVMSDFSQPTFFDEL